MAISRTGWGERLVSFLAGSHAFRGRGVATGLSAVVTLLAASPGLGQSVLYVDVKATGPVHDGSSWCSAYTALQDALADARALEGLITEIRVADGVYKPDQGANQVPGDREASFQLINGVAVRGGYAGCGATDPDERNVTLHETILSGDLRGDDGPNFSNNEENSYHVVTGSGTDATAVLDGFTITGGNANQGSVPHSTGGGMYNDAGSPTVNNCTFSWNTAGFSGGMSNYLSSPTVTNCTFSGNSAKYGGGGMSNNSSSPTVTNCTFTGNSAHEWGGGMFNLASNPTVTNCTFTGNSAHAWGGGMCNWGGSPTLTNCTFSGNLATSRGGGMYNYSSSPTVTNCTFTANTANYRVGGMYNAYDSAPTVTNCILWRNRAGEIYNFSSTPVVTYSNVRGGYTGTGNIDEDPLFVRAPDPGADRTWGTEDDDYGDLRLRCFSPCIDAADNATVLMGVTTDLGGHPRFVNDPLVLDTGDPGAQGPPIVDMGAYERQVVLLDILPMRCPNRISVKSRRPVPMAIVGTDTFDVMQIDPDSLILTRADGVGGSARPVMRKPGHGITIKDVATPFNGDLCDCHKLHGDGIDDLVAMFSMGDMADVLELGAARRGEQVMLTVSGLLLDGDPFEASDCILITGRPYSPAQQPLPVRRR